MPKPLPRSYAALIGGVIRDARVATDGDHEQLVIELQTGAQYAVAAGKGGKIEVSELQPPEAAKSTRPPSEGTTPSPSLQAVAGAVQSLLRDL